MTKNDKIEKTLDLARYTYDHPTDLVRISELIEMLTDDPLGVDSSTIKNLDFFKTSQLRVKEYTSSVIAKLQKQLK